MRGRIPTQGTPSHAGPDDNELKLDATNDLIIID
jgi:hypothetical protein